MFDWKIGLFILQIITAMISLTGFLVIRFNDLHHLSLDMKATKQKLNEIEKDINAIKEKQSAQLAVCDERHGISKR